MHSFLFEDEWIIIFIEDLIILYIGGIHLKADNKITPDIAVKVFFRDNVHYASIINAVLFDGEQVISPDELEALDSEESGMILKRDQTTVSLERRRDIIKRAVVEGYEVILGLENQQYEDSSMALRVYGYDYLDYKKQYENDKVINPVFTIVIYYGERKNVNFGSLEEMTTGVPERLRRYFDDKRVLYVDIKNINPEYVHDEETRSLVEAVQRLYEFRDIESLRDIVLSPIVSLVAGTLTGTPGLIEEAYEKEGGEVVMCRAVEDYYNKIIANEKALLSLKFDKEKESLIEYYDKEKEALTQTFQNEKIETVVNLLNRSLGKISNETMERIRRSSNEIVEELLMNIFDILSEEDIINRIEDFDREYLLV